MDRDDQVMAWVQGYIERAGATRTADAVTRLFTEDVRYRTLARTRSRWSGTPPLEEFWFDDAGRDLHHAQPELGRGRRTSAPSSASRCATASASRQEYRDLWLLRFADDGRVDDFEEWAYWPGKPYTASAEA